MNEQHVVEHRVETPSPKGSDKLQTARTILIQNTPFVARPGDVVAQMGIFWLLLQAAKNSKPRWPAPLRWMQAAIWFNMFQGADTLHTLGHILSARSVGAPMDAITTRLGIQTTVYHNNDVTPEQHIGRAIGGPLASGAATVTGYLFWRGVHRIPVLGWLAKTWYIMNALALAASMAPAPSCDGGTLLHWFTKLQSGEEALGDEAVQQIGYATAAGVMLAAGLMLLRGKWMWALGCAGFAMFIVADLMGLIGKKGA
jgi:Zn-dependent protease